MNRNDTERPLYSLEEEDTPLYQIADEPTDKPSLENPTYSIDDEDDEDDDDDSLDDDESTSDASAVEKVKRPSPFGIMLKTMFGPVEGWKALKRARFKTEDFAARCFYPVIALAAISDASIFFYEANMTFSDWAKAGVTTFVSFFFGYFTILLFGDFILPKRSRDVLKKDIGRQFVMLALSTLALFGILLRLLPMLEPVLVFLPLWTVYMVFKGVRLLRVPKEVQNSTTGLLCMLIIGVPLLWDWLMSLLLGL